MRFLADMCVAIGVVEWLREQGHDAIHLRDQNLHRMPNGEIFEKGIKEDRIIFSFKSKQLFELSNISRGWRKA